MRRKSAAVESDGSGGTGALPLRARMSAAMATGRVAAIVGRRAVIGQRGERDAQAFGQGPRARGGKPVVELGKDARAASAKFSGNRSRA